jgi:selenocysteine lyase/cysteine desulfurase
MADYFEALSSRHGGPDSGAPAARLAHDLMRSKEVALLQPLLEYLGGRNDVRLLGPTEATRRAPTVAVELPGAAEPVAAALASHGIMAGGGDFYAVRPLRSLGIDPAKGVLRMSFTHYTSEEEVAQLIQALDEVLPG